MDGLTGLDLHEVTLLALFNLLQSKQNELQRNHTKRGYI